MTPVPGNSKLTDSATLEKFVRENPDRKFILAGGIFDIIHPSHIRLIEFASALGDVLITAVREEGIHTPLAERLEILNEMEKIGHLFTFSGNYGGEILPGLCHRIVVSGEFQLAEPAARHSDKTVIFPG